jgi:hypothetical protein
MPERMMRDEFMKYQVEHFDYVEYQPVRFIERSEDLPALRRRDGLISYKVLAEDLRALLARAPDAEAYIITLRVGKPQSGQYLHDGSERDLPPESFYAPAGPPSPRSTGASGPT